MGTHVPVAVARITREHLMDISKTYLIAAPIDDLWRALTDPTMMDEWGAGPAEMDAKSGGEFSQWGGDIHGTVTEIDPPNRLVEEWYGGEWAQPSTAVFTLATVGGDTRVSLEHTNVPDDEAADFDAGWDDYYFGPIRELLER
jgi:uncharacterized protein YndB with AHSA1/START domain